ncbi:hypothetical protein [Bremerella cremea]|uniref:hypothetical protein n=1 Tax=Bremerella cremea TaxID=1031537 RepID=UPI0011C03C04|nr:hypothetical protein [Bremerella cremea]
MPSSPAVSRRNTAQHGCYQAAKLPQTQGQNHPENGPVSYRPQGDSTWKPIMIRVSFYTGNSGQSGKKQRKAID